MPTDIAPDGSPVELYAHWLPELGEAELIHDLSRRGGTILDLGCGAGRVTRGLVRLGHRVIAVDESDDMLAALASLEGVERVRARIEELDLSRTFDTVVLASTLVNTAEHDLRAAMLRSCRRHVSLKGVVLIERMDPRWADPGWARVKASSPGRIGDVEVITTDLHVEPPLCTQTIEYRVEGGRSWVQGPFTSRILDDAELEGELVGAGLRLDRWLAWRGTRSIWCSARPLP